MLVAVAKHGQSRIPTSLSWRLFIADARDPATLARHDCKRTGKTEPVQLPSRHRSQCSSHHGVGLSAGY